MNKKNKVFRAIVTACEPEESGSDVILLTLKLYTREKFLAEAGQFVVLSPRSDASIAPRPFTIVHVNDVFVSILFKAVGKNTKLYSEMKMGDRLWVFGPYGTGIKFSPENEKCIFVGGGIGGAALVMPVKKAIAGGKKVSVFLGAKDESQLTGLSFFDKMGIKVIFTLDINRGLVTDILKEALEKDGGVSEVIACGPKVMLHKVANLCNQYGNKCQVIIDEMMACGMGSCKGCAIFGGAFGDELKHVCSDGPAFDAKWIYWTKFMLTAVFTGGNILSKEAVEMDSTCHLGPLTLKYPTMNCSGTLDLEACRDGSMDISHLGAFVTKGLSLRERSGNPMPRVCETPSGMLNSIGLEYIGLERFKEEALPELLKLGIPIIANINGESVEEYVNLAVSLRKTGIAAFEVNISCPNVKNGGMLFGKDPRMAREIVEKVCFFANGLPVIVKLTPNVTDIGVIARAVEKAGANIISLVNTVAASAINVWTCKPKIASVSAGLSGPAIHPIAVWNVMQVYQDVEIPIIGMGGNENGYTAAEFMIAGATATAFGTCGFSNRNIYTDAIKELAEVALFHGFTSTERLVGRFFD